jgi:hypothetical protein
MVVNFRAHKISQNTRKLIRTPMLIIIIIINLIEKFNDTQAMTIRYIYNTKER